ncbi:MAG: ABC transporter permease [Chitinophagaceae bacterium]|nr:MAG: ABC transporter permease [Chitinophagaceae bacterium]
MSVLKITLKNIFSKPLHFFTTILLFIVGIGIISVLLLTSHFLTKSMDDNIRSIDLVVGAKGSPMQLILSSVFHVDFPTGNISVEEARIVTDHPMVRRAVPVALGDSYGSYRIVGTDASFFDLYELELKEGRNWDDKMEAVVGYNVFKQGNLKIGDTFYGAHGLDGEGHIHDDHEYIVVGILNHSSSVANNLILTPIESVWYVHDHDHDHDHHHHDHDHDHHHHDHDHHHHDHDHDHNHDHHDHGHSHSHDDHNHHNHNHDHDHSHDHNHDHGHHNGHDHSHDHSHDDKEHVHGPDCDHDDHHHEKSHSHNEEHAYTHDQSGRAVEGFIQDPSQSRLQFPYWQNDGSNEEITSLLVEYSSRRATVSFPYFIQNETSMQTASPAIETARLFTLLGVGLDTLRWIAFAVILIGMLSIFTSLYNTFKERKYELAIMRALGGSRFKIFSIIILEGAIYGLIGTLLGVLSGHIFMSSLQQLVRESQQFAVSGMIFLPEESILIIAGLSAGLIAAIIPAIQAYKMDISTILGKGYQV